jgi:hypothetical protein
MSVKKKKNNYETTIFLKQLASNPSAWKVNKENALHRLAR